MQDLFERASKYLARARRRRLWMRVVSVLACVVILGTTYAQILTAVTMETSVFEPDGHVHTEECYKTVKTEEKRELDCPLELHTHTADCYDADGELTCGYVDFVVHTHDSNCYDENGRLVCTLPEIEEHTHTAQCWPLAEDEAFGVLAAAPHVHTEDCYTVSAGELICGQEETDGHTHDESCYIETEKLVCGLEEEPPHTHDDACYDLDGELMIEHEETEGHTHDASCYETVKELACELEETEPHHHTDECYAQEKELTCGLGEETEAAAPSVSFDAPEEQQEPLCGLEEVELHTHTAACYGADGSLVCGQLEVKEHQHTEECFRVVQEASEEKVLDCPYTASDETEKDGDDTEKDPAEDGTGDKADDETEDETSDKADGETEGETGDKTDGETEGEIPEPAGPSAAEKLLEEAQSQIGYAESADLYIEEEGERRGYTIYGEYYGLPYEKWDAMFVAYCMEKAGVENIPSAAECLFDIDLWAAMLAGKGCYQAADFYAPAPGDLAFFDLDADGCADFVAVVERATESTLYLIAGDSKDCVRRVSYNLEDESIVGYGVLADEKTEDPMDGEQDSEEDLPEADPDDGLPEDDAEQDSEKDPSEGEDAGKDPNEEGADGALDETEPDTGDTPQKAADKLLAVARGQIGYTESAEDYIEEDGERRGSTLYGEYYDSPYSKWDAMFVAYCLEKAGIEELPGMEDCGFDLNLWITLLNEAEYCVPAEGYSPMPGDLVFFDTDEDGAADHIAIVEKVADGRLWVIAGDSSDCVRRMSYSTDDPQVLCYAVLPVETEPGDTDGDTEDGQQPEMTVQTVSADTLTVHAVYEKGVLPEGALLSVTAYDPESDKYDAIKQQMTESMADSGRILAGVYPIEIHFEDEYGGEIEPEGSVTVTVMFEEPIQESAAEWAVFHLTDGAVEELEDAAVLRQEQAAAAYALAQEDELLAPAADEALPAFAEEDGLPAAQDDEENEQAVQGIVFETDSFSDFVLAGAYDVSQVEEVEHFMLWLHWYSESVGQSTQITGYGNDVAPSWGIENPSVQDALRIKDTNCYLIPIGYFTENYKEYGYTFDTENLTAGRLYKSVFEYAPSAYASQEGLKAAYYVQVDEEWYVQIQDTGSYSDPSAPRSNVYFQCIESEITPVSEFRLWLHEATRAAEWDMQTHLVLSRDGTNAITDALKQIENGKTYYLVPVKYCEEAFAQYGYTFDPNDTRVCPLVYAPDANNGSANLTAASYVYYEPEDNPEEGKWYIRLQDTGTYTNSTAPRSNTYYYHYSLVTDTKNHPGTVINLFDYWVNEDETDADGNVISGRYLPDTYEYNAYDTGINRDKELKFLLNAGNWLEENGYPLAGYNVWTKKADVYTGMVNKTLKDGYPTLSSEIDPNKTSLAYLFDPNEHNAYKASYSNVSGLLQVNSQGYYYYDSMENYAEFNGSDAFDLYEVPGVKTGGSTAKGQFFPFNSMSQVGELKSTDEPLNHYFGMTLFTRFYQRTNGLTEYGEQTKFSFSGDDDVWIFIDGVLVADLGGNHDAATVTINFATGLIDITESYNNAGSQPKTLREAFEAAGEVNKVYWAGNTFKEDTTHTLSFFYMERGNTDSNLKLEYNLVDVPITSLVKVNQYGERVSGAEFTLYATDSDWSEGSKAEVFTKTTDYNGEIIFADEMGIPYGLDELQRISNYKTHFILEETKAPEGYRKVSEDVRLYIQDGLLLCDNAYTSGSWASSTLLVTASSTIYKNGDRAPITYFDVAQGTANGTLFAVVLKRVGTGNDNRSWAPVSGNAVDGYTVHEPGGDFIAAAIEAAQEAKKDGDVEFSLSGSGTMAVELTNLPGDITTYYYMKKKSDSTAAAEDAQYTVAYYWTEGTLEDAISTNTYLIDANAAPDESYSGFTRVFGATILVPNLSNRLMVQKLDENGDLTDGATFALYEVKEDANKKVYYVGDNDEAIYLSPDDNGDNKGNAEIGGKEYKYTIDKQTGVITVTQTTSSENGEEPTETPIATITPRECGITGPDDSAKENGTYTFTNLTNGYYYVREIDAPSGYKLNTTEVMVLVNDEAIYANAGTADDGVTVARGPGYLVKSLSQFASEGDIDNTLTWIYEMMRISGEKLSFADFKTELETQCSRWSYLKTNRTGETAGHDEPPLKVYLKYNPPVEGGSALEGVNALFNYEVNTDQYNRNDTTLPSRRLYTTVGWSYYEIYQDTEWGEQYHADAAYTDLSGKEIANLFSRSTYIQVTDRPYTYELPSTGGRGRLVYTVCGLALIAAPLMYQLLRRRKGGM